MSTFCSADDVKRILRDANVNATKDARIQAAVDAVNSWADRQLWKTTIEGPQVETYFDVQEDATLELPGDDVTVTAIRLFEYPSSQGVWMSPADLGLGHGYDITDNGRLILRPLLFWSPFEGASATRRLRQYARVEVFYEGTGLVPRAITEGVAFLAAGWYTDGPRALRGLTQERIGDYSYTLGDLTGEEGVPSFVKRAQWMLAPFLKKAKVTVV